MSVESAYVTLISSDQTDSSTIHLGEHRSEIVEKVVEYLMFKDRYSNSKDPKEEIPDFQDRVRPEIALELLMASDFMGC